VSSTSQSLPRCVRAALQLSKPIEDASFSKGISRYLKFEKSQGAEKADDKKG